MTAFFLNAIHRGVRAARAPQAKAPKLTATDVRNMRALYADGMTYQQVGDLFGMTRPAVARICQGRSVAWAHIARTHVEQ